MAVSSFLKREVPLLIIIGFTIPMLLSRYITDPTLTTINTELGFWSAIIANIGWGLGVVYLFQGEYHNTKMNRNLTQYVSFATLIVFSLLLVVMATTLPGDIMNGSYLWVYYGFYRAQSTAFYGLMFLYLGSGTYRVLRARSIESTVLMVAGLLYLFRNASMFQMYFPWLTPLGEWIINYPNKAATIAATICATFGALLIAMRQLLGRERTAIEVR
jgi:hypothetical protein